ncbi:MAG: hypothetical protein LBP80_07190 [Treponema sp.]|nr:hypothetical protein [Treponema sp.]
MKISGTAVIPFSVSLGKEHFPYLTEKQLRLCLAHLREQGCIRRAHEKERSMDRTSWFRLNDQVYQYYLHVMIMEQGRLAEVMLPSSGDF